MRAAKADRNQPDIVRALREYGCSVLHLHTLGTPTVAQLLWAPQGERDPVPCRADPDALRAMVERVLALPGAGGSS